MNWQQLLSSNRSGKLAGSVDGYRSAFEQDFDRIIFSHPFRRLQDKTQVHPLPEHDFVHTRLTHSLEVSSVGRSLGKQVGEVVLQRHPALVNRFSLFDFGAIVAAASLAHDVGNPPFGHAGEDAISDFFIHNARGRSFQSKVTEAQWSDLLKFEGNAQGFRIITSGHFGLRLTNATLGAFTKYPCPSFFPLRDKSKRSQKKFGFFESEKPVFSDIANQLELLNKSEHVWARHPLAFLVEAADDICYSVIDLEDGCSLGLVSLDDTVSLLAAILKDDFKPEKLAKIASRAEKIGALRALVIKKLVDELSQIFLDNESGILNGSFDKALVDECTSKNALKEIINVSVEKIYRARQVVEIEAAGHEVLPGLLEEFITAGDYAMNGSSSRKYENLQKLLPAEVVTKIVEQKDAYAMLRLIIDFVSGLTDRHALSLFRKIKGISV